MNLSNKIPVLVVLRLRQNNHHIITYWFLNPPSPAPTPPLTLLPWFTGHLSSPSCPLPTERRREGPRPAQPHGLEPVHPRPQKSDSRAETRGEIREPGLLFWSCSPPRRSRFLLFIFLFDLVLFSKNFTSRSLICFFSDKCQLHPETSCTHMQIHACSTSCRLLDISLHAGRALRRDYEPGYLIKDIRRCDEV